MALMTSLLSSLLSRVIGEEISAWVPKACGALLRYSVRRLPESQRMRFSEEWQSHVNEVPGTIGKLCAAADFSRAAVGMGLLERHKEAAKKWLHTAEHLKDSHSKVLAVINRVLSIEGAATAESAKPHIEKLNLFRAHLEKINKEVALLPVFLAQYAEEPCTLLQRLRNRRALKQVEDGFETISKWVSGLDQIVAQSTKALASKGYLLK